MGFEIINSENYLGTRKEYPAITFHCGTGRISLNISLVTLLDLKKGDSILFAFDDDKKSFYITLSEDETKSVFIINGKRNTQYWTHCKEFCRHVVQKMNKAGVKSLRFNVDEDRVPIQGRMWFKLNVMKARE